MQTQRIPEQLEFQFAKENLTPAQIIVGTIGVGAGLAGLVGAYCCLKEPCVETINKIISGFYSYFTY